MKSYINRIVLIVFLLGAALGLTSCNSKEKALLQQEVSNLKAQLEMKESEVLKINDQLKHIKEVNVSLKEANMNLKKEVSVGIYHKNLSSRFYEEIEFLKRSLADKSGLITEILSNNASSEYDFFPLYTKDANTGENYFGSFCIVSKNLSLKDKLEKVAHTISADFFGGLPMNVLDIKLESGKKIAYINLEDKVTKDNSDDYHPETWAHPHFDGTTGGFITTLELTYSILSPEYDGEWIDGVQFLYNGKSVDSQHAEGLLKTVYRKDLRKLKIQNKSKK